MRIDGLKMLEKRNPQIWHSQITVQIVDGFHGLRFSRNLRHLPAIYQECEPAIVWIKNDEVVHYLLFVFRKHRDECFRRLMQNCHDLGAEVMPSHQSFVGSMNVIFAWNTTKQAENALETDVNSEK